MVTTPSQRIVARERSSRATIVVNIKFPRETEHTIVPEAKGSYCFYCIVINFERKTGQIGHFSLKMCMLVLRNSGVNKE